MFVTELETEIHMLDCVQEGNLSRVTVDLATRLIVVSKVRVRIHTVRKRLSPSPEHVAARIRYVVHRYYPHFEVVSEVIDSKGEKHTIH